MRFTDWLRRRLIGDELDRLNAVITRLQCRTYRLFDDGDDYQTRIEHLTFMLNAERAKRGRATVHIAQLRRQIVCTGCQGWRGRALRAEEVNRRYDERLALDEVRCDA